MRYFHGHYGKLYLVPDQHSAFAVTRLMVSTVGYFDENLYPAYDEDIDWNFRMNALGFRALSLQTRISERQRSAFFYHKRHGNWKGATKTSQYDTEDNSTVIAYANTRKRRGSYYFLFKYGKSRARLSSDTFPRQIDFRFEFFNVPRFPLDTIVKDPALLPCFAEKRYAYDRQVWVRPARCVYNLDALRESGILSEEQVGALQEMPPLDKYA